MSDLVWSSVAQLRQIAANFPLSHGLPRVDDRRMIHSALQLSADDPDGAAVVPFEAGAPFAVFGCRGSGEALNPGAASSRVIASHTSKILEN